MAKLSPIGNVAQFINGVPAVGAKLFTYAAGSSTKQTTYTDEAGTIPQTNPIILDSRGEPTQPIWLTEGLSYDFVFTASTDSDPPTSPIWDVPDVTGVNDASVAVDQWVDSGVTPTYVSATIFTLPGDQTTAFHNKRRIKVLVTAGTAYGTILSSVFGALTTVTVVMDSTPLDSGLSSVQLGLLTYTSSSIPSIVESSRATVAATATTTPLWSSTAQVQDWTGTPTITDFPAAPRAGAWRVVYPAAGTIITDNGAIDVEGDQTYTTEAGDQIYVEALTTSTFKVMIKPKSGLPIRSTSRIQPISATVAANAMTLTLNPTTLDFRSSTLGSGSVSTRQVASAITTVISSGSTGGTVSGNKSRIAVLAIDNAGTVELAWCNAYGYNVLDESTLITTVAEGGAGGADSANVIYSTTARSNIAFRVVGYVESTQATAGTWATAPSLIQGFGGIALSKMFDVVNNVPTASTSGTSLDFNNIPSWVKEIDMMFIGFSTSGTSDPLIQIGDSGGLETTGYLGGSTRTLNAVATAGSNYTTGFGIASAAAANVLHGVVTLKLLDAATNTWVAFGVLGFSTLVGDVHTGGSKSLSGVLDRIRLTTVGGADTFDAGTVNINFK